MHINGHVLTQFTTQCESDLIGAIGETNSHLQQMGKRIRKEFTDIHTNEQSHKLTQGTFTR